MQVHGHSLARIAGLVPAMVTTAVAIACVLVARPGLEGADARTEYYERLAKLPVRNAEVFVDLGLWCQSAGLQDKATECFQRAISVDSDCEKARLALGYRRYGTGWIKQGESPRSQAKLPALKVAQSPAPEESKEAPAGDGPGASAAGASASVASRGGAGSSAAPKPAGKQGSPAETGEGSAETGKAPPVTGKPEVSLAPKPEEKPGAKPAPQDPGSEGLEVEVKVKKPKDGAAGKAIAAEIEKKRAAAQAAAEKIGVTFFTYEDNDFMVHSTLSTSSREVKTLVSNLKGLKRVLSQMIGSGSGSKIWPDKLQFFLLKSEPEFERFAEMVDGIKSAKNPDGAYAQGDHTVVLDPDTDILPRVVGGSSLEKLGGSSRYVGWWLKEGIGELLHAQSAAGQKELYYPQTMRHAADIIQSEGQGLKIFNLIETADYKPKDKDRNRALTLSLLDYLFKKSRGGVRDLVAALKSEKAPAPPSTQEEFKAFFNLSYRSFQEEALKSAFHMPVDALGEQWKAYVLAVVEKLNADEAAKSTDAAKKKGTAKKDKRAK